MTAEEARDIGQQIQDALRRLTWVTIALAILLVGLTVYVYVNTSNQADDIRNVTVRTTRALCTFRHDLAERVAQGNSFLHSHPNGFAGIPAPVLRQSINGQARTIRALRELNCPPYIPSSPLP